MKERERRKVYTAHLYPSKKARALLKVGVGMPRVTAVATTLRQESCTVEWDRQEHLLGGLQIDTSF